MNKKSIIIYIDSLSILDKLSLEQRGNLFTAIRDYNSEIFDETKLDAITNIAFEPFKNQFDRDNKKYDTICERNKINGLKGGRPITQDNPKNPSGLSDNPKEPKEPTLIKDSDKDSDNKKKKKKEIVFVPPTLNEVILFFKEAGYVSSIAEKAFNYYHYRNWINIQDKPVKNWKTTMSNNWFKDEYKITDANNNSRLDWKGNPAPSSQHTLVTDQETGKKSWTVQ